MRQYNFLVFLILFFFTWTVAEVYAEAEGDKDRTGVEEILDDQEEYEGLDLEDEFEDESADHVFDPLGGYNRFMTKVNDKLYFWVLKPVAKGFSIVIPEAGRKAINHCFRNILFPVRLVNNLLQFKIKRAGIETARFGVNTTIGVLGLADPAKSWLNLEAYEEDFGQTLGHYGVGGGFHLVLPLLGPSNVRDTIGMVPDYFLNPINYIGNYKYEAGITAVKKFNFTSLHLGEYEDIKKDALDLYIFLRDAYEQNRDMRIAE